MKLTILHCSLLSFTFLAFASPIAVDSQLPLVQYSSDQYPGFSLDLNEQRLIQFEDASEVWMTELEKIKAKADGVRFLDMLSYTFLQAAILLIFHCGVRTDTHDLGSSAVARLSTVSACMKTSTCIITAS